MIIAVDPGLNTGIAFRFDNEAWGTITVPNDPDPAARLHGVMDTIMGRAGYFDRGARQQVRALVVESFVTMGYLSRYGIETLELVGALKGLCYLFGITMVKQTPAERTSMEPRAKDMLKKRGARFTDHEVSALAHLLTYERRSSSAVQDPAEAMPTSDSNDGAQPPHQPGQTKISVRKV